MNRSRGNSAKDGGSQLSSWVGDVVVLTVDEFVAFDVVRVGTVPINDGLPEFSFVVDFVVVVGKVGEKLSDDLLVCGALLLNVKLI